MVGIPVGSEGLEYLFLCVADFDFSEVFEIEYLFLAGHCALVIKIDHKADPAGRAAGIGKLNDLAAGVFPGHGRLAHGGFDILDGCNAGFEPGTAVGGAASYKHGRDGHDYDTICHEFKYLPNQLPVWDVPVRT